MTSTAADVLRRALLHFGPDGENWVRHAPHSHERHCSLSAIACGHLPGWRAAEEYLADAVGGAFVPTWNDAPGRTFAEVKAAFEKAITLAEQGEAQ